MGQLTVTAPRLFRSPSPPSASTRDICTLKHQTYLLACLEGPRISPPSPVAKRQIGCPAPLGPVDRASREASFDVSRRRKHEPPAVGWTGSLKPPLFLPGQAPDRRRSRHVCQTFARLDLSHAPGSYALDLDAVDDITCARNPRRSAVDRWSRGILSSEVSDLTVIMQLLFHTDLPNTLP